MIIKEKFLEDLKKDADKYCFLYMGKKLIFNAKPLESEGIRNGTMILAVEIEEDHIINDKIDISLDDLDIEDIISIKLISHDNSFFFNLQVTGDMTATDLIIFLTKEITSKFPEKSKNEFYFLYNGKKLDYCSKTLESLGIDNGTTFITFEIKPLLNENLDLDVSVLIDDNNKHQIVDFNLHGLLKFCIIKEVSFCIDSDLDYYKPKLNKKMKHILEIVSGGNIDLNQTENSIRSVLKKFEGINILNFSKFVDAFVSKQEFIETFNILRNEDKMKISKINNCLSSYSEYMKKFEEEFDLSRKNSVFEWRITSMTIVDRKDLKNFETSKNNCPNRKDRILYHGTSIVPSSKILSDMFIRSVKDKCAILGKGVYFTDTLDYAWYYGGKEHKRDNLNKIPKVEDRFILVGSYIYYDTNGFKKVDKYKHTPKKNEITFAYADSGTRIVTEPDKTKFYGTEYVIFEYDQICPFLGLSLKRDEFCVIWKDDNFSPNPVYNNKFDEIFKKFLARRMEYIQEQIKFNVYPCETSEEALELVKRKKYSKIILISNAGKNLSGKQFIIDARKIIGNDVIALFLCYQDKHLKWIKEMKNAIFSNEPEFYENYLQSFVTESDIDEETKTKKIKKQLIILINQIQQKYKVNFNFSNDFLQYPLFKKEGFYKDLTF